ncbi:carbohydrate ABC transporter permease [Paenibacillus sp. GCM10027626]|uniref:carbohydrate ABC transporter permease n=1 Tax=Paenibacillus sp. GCM10027626 TaxID=3273411 RepID=UPI003626C240
MKARPYREKGQRSLTYTAYAVTIAFIVLSLVPLFWMISSSMKDNMSIYIFPPKWLPKQPQTIVLQLQYPEEGADGSMEEYELDAMKATWFTWKKLQNEPIGEMKIIGIRGDRQIYEANTPAYLFNTGRAEIVPTPLFKESLIQSKLPIIKEKQYSAFEWYGAVGPRWTGEREQAAAGTVAAEAAKFLGSVHFLAGEVVSVTQQGNWLRVLDNYLVLWKLGSGSEIGFQHYLGNSFIVTAASILLQLIVGGFAGYALSHLVSKRTSRWLTLFFVATLMVPEIAILVPLYLTMEKLNLVNTLWGIILPHSAWGIVIFLFKGFFDQLPGELLQAARIDGARELNIFARIVTPMSYPILTVVAVMTFIAVWNEFMWPLVIARKQEVWTFTVALNDFQNRPEFDTNVLMASLVISTLPLLIVFSACQRLIEKGVSWTGVKG